MAKTKAPTSVEVNFEGVEDFEPGQKKVLVDPGTYPAIVSAAKLAKSKAGNRMMVVEFAIKGGKFAGEKLAKYCVLDGKGAGITRQVLYAWHDKAELVATFELVPENYIGEKAYIAVEEDEFENEYGTFPSRAVSRVLSFEDEEAKTAAQATRNSEVAEEADDAEPPF